jgi:phosphatidylserine decarboxylase
MYIHKEGFKLITVSAIGLFFANVLLFALFPDANKTHWVIGSISLLLFAIVLQFFRNPTRTIASADDNIVYAPADGKVVVIEEAVESEYFKGEKRLQVSVFMSPINVHVNRNPISGVVNYFKYHPGKYLVAWHPKASTENERTTVVYANPNGVEILMRQIAGALAKRIVWYVDKGTQVTQGEDMGFIKFGSRVDLYLPLDAKIEVNLQQKVHGNKTIIARLK